MTCRPLALSFALVVGCFDPSTDDVPDDDGGTSTTAASATADDTATTTMTTGLTTSSSVDDGPSDETSPSTTEPGTTDGTGTDDETGTTSAADDTTESTGGGPVACNPVLDDCGADEYCDAPDCVSQGICMPRPVDTDAVMLPACGCDGTSYWNVTHAHWLGATAIATDISGCGTDGATCNGDGDCAAPGASCVTDHGLGPASCANAELGNCWGIPANATCDGAPLQPDVGFGSCTTGPNQCDMNAVLLCEAILAGDYFAICL